MILRATEPKPEMTGVNVRGFQRVTALFAKAKEHLKYPKVILQCEGQKVLMSVAGAGSKFPGMINVTCHERKTLPIESDDYSA